MMKNTISKRSKRTKRDIMAHIMEKLRDHKTMGIMAITYSVQLQHNQGKEIVTLMINRGLVKKIDRSYSATPRGIKWLKSFQDSEAIFWDGMKK